jgi:uroporphyrinogen III methyltransferase/synthase
VVRLKGGDPFIFGRGGEEAEALAEARIRFEVVPGVTSAVGVAAYTGIPLTDRRFTSELTFVSGHDVDAIDWPRLAKAGTLVVFMGLVSFADIARRLVQSGRAAATPAAAIRWGTRGDQVTVEGTLADLQSKIEASGLKPPALIVAGDVVSLRQRINWFESLPLFGRTVVVTRARRQAADLSDALRELGANVVELPTIEIRPPDDWSALDRAVREIGEYDWLIFTSVNGVRSFVQRLDASKKDLRDLRARLCAIGPATAAAVEALHLRVNLLPEAYVAESVLAAFEKMDLAGKRMLLPRAQKARDLIPEGLKRRGARIDVVPAYQTVIPEQSRDRAAEIFSAGATPDWVTFTSSSTVTHFVELCGAKKLDGVRVASIGPITTATARQLGIEVHVEPREYTVAGLIQAIVDAQLGMAV